MSEHHEKTLEEFQIPIVISDSTVEVLDNPAGIDFGTGLDVLDNGDGTITVNGGDLSGYVPYTGATADVDLGVHDLYTLGDVGIGTTTPSYPLEVEGYVGADAIQFDLDPTIAEHAEGLLHWNSDDGTLEVGMPGGEVKLQVGQEILVRGKAIGSDINNGQLVYVSGASGSKPEFTLAKADALATSESTLAMSTEDTSQNSSGYVTAFGLVRDVPVPTATFTAGDTLYLDASTAGAFTNVEPTSPNYAVKIGYVLRAHDTEGVIFISVHPDIWKTTLVQDYVPYTGATADVDLGNHSLTCGSTQAGQSTIASGLVVNDGGGNTAQDDLRVKGGTDDNLLFVDASADKVGIGTTSPSYKLDVDGDINISDGEEYKINGEGVMTYLAATNVLQIGDIGSVPFDTTFLYDNTEVMRVTDGKVGIGTATPDARLHLFNDWGEFGSSNPFLKFRYGSSSHDVLSTYMDSNYSINFANLDTSSSGHINLLPYGNVGIGTTSPGAKLNILESSGGVTTRPLMIQNPNPSNNTGVGISFSLNSGNGIFASIDAVRPNLPTGGDTDLIFNTYNSGFSEKMRIKSNGFVGIGTTSPQEHLHVSGDGSSQRVEIENTTSGASVLKLTNTEGSFGWVSDSGYFGMYDYSGLGTVFAINAGNVGIGTTDPSTTLHLYGDENGEYYPLRLNNAQSGAADGVGQLFSLGSASKGGILYNRAATYGRGDFHLLLNNDADTTDAVLADSVFTVTRHGAVGIRRAAPTSILDVLGSVAFAYEEKTTDYSLGTYDHQVNVTANTVTITLPSAGGIAGRMYSIKNTGTGAVTVDGTGAETIDGALTQTVDQWENIKIMSTGAAWIII